MYQRLSSVLFPLLALLFVGSIYWGYEEHQQKNSILVKAENQYQGAFHDLSYQVDQLHHQLGSTLAVNAASQGFQRKSLVNVWRMTSQAQSDLNRLPVSVIPLNKTEDFLSHISNFAYKASTRDLTKQPLSDGEMNTMKTLYSKSTEIAQELAKVQEKVLQDKLRWMDVETAMAADKQKSGNVIVDGFKGVDSKMDKMASVDWGPSVSGLYEKRSVAMLSGKPVSAEEIKVKAANFLGLSSTNGIHVVENGKGTNFTSFSAVVNEKQTGKNITLDFTSRGGSLIGFVHPRDVADKKLGMKEARGKADEFLTKHGYKDMRPVTYDEYGKEGVFTYVGSKNGVLIYPDKLNVKVALDKGDIIGLQASDYVFAHKDRKLPKPAMTEAEVRGGLSAAMKKSPAKLALIKNDDNKEVLCYEFKGESNGSKYRIYLNAATGLEEAVEELPGASRS
jgi:spore germination protein